MTLVVMLGVSSCSDGTPTDASYGLKLAGMIFDLLPVGEPTTFGYVEFARFPNARDLDANFNLQSYQNGEPRFGLILKRVVHIEDDGGFAFLAVADCYSPQGPNPAPCNLRLEARRTDLANPTRPAFRMNYTVTRGQEVTAGLLTAPPPPCCFY